MAGIKPPKPFDFQNAADWPAWMDEFDDYCSRLGYMRKKTKFKNRRHLFLLQHGGETSPVRMEQHPRNSEPTDATDKDIVATKSSDIQEPRSSNKTSSPEQRTTRYGRVIQAPKRLGIDD
ncbi:hypothetical protein MRX96_023042 [Rhipicephalus microplus]